MCFDSKNSMPNAVSPSYIQPMKGFAYTFRADQMAMHHLVPKRMCFDLW